LPATLPTGGGNEGDYNFKVGVKGLLDERYEISFCLHSATLRTPITS